MKGEGDNKHLTIMHDLFITTNNNDNSIKERENASHQHIHQHAVKAQSLKLFNPDNVIQTKDKYRGV